MAKLIGPIGSKMRGKVGQIVAAKTVGGDTAIRSYQPQVKNPNTKRQQASRQRFKLASGVVSVLAEAINIGYAKATSGAKMYPRNMAVRELVKDTQCIIMNDGEFESIELAELKVSKKMGIDIVPQIAYTAPTAQTEGSLALRNVTDFDPLLAEGKIGMVVVAVRDNGDGTLAMPKLYKGNAASPIAITESEAMPLTGCTLLGFVKVIPESGNSVATDTWPWKYPSATSVTVSVGTV